MAGRAEADFARFDAKTVVRNIYILFSRSDIPIAPENQEIMDLVQPSTPLPPWITEEDLAMYGALYEKSGFQTALQVPYRTSGEDLKLADPVVKVPALLIMGEEDYVCKFPGIEELTKGEKAKEFVPKIYPRRNTFCSGAIPRPGESAYPRLPWEAHLIEKLCVETVS